MKQLDQLFLNLGASEKETQTFLKLLELGAQPVSVIARYMNVPRTSMYPVLERLKQLQLIDEFERAGIKYVKCISVKELKSVFSDRLKKMNQVMSQLDEQLPELERIQATMVITPKVNFFEGKEAVAKMYKKILESREFCSMFHPRLIKKIMPEYFHTIPQELKQNKGSAKELLVDCPEAREYKKKYQNARHLIKILPKTLVFSSDTIISRDTIYMVSYGKNDISALEIVNAPLADTQKKIFEKMWGDC